MPVKLAKILRSVTTFVWHFFITEFHLCIYTKLWMLPYLLANFMIYTKLWMLPYILANFMITHSLQLNENRKIMPFHDYLCYFLCIVQQG